MGNGQMGGKATADPSPRSAKSRAAPLRMTALMENMVEVDR
jgi:hypothetical protein